MSADLRVTSMTQLPLMSSLGFPEVEIITTPPHVCLSVLPLKCEPIFAGLNHIVNSYSRQRVVLSRHSATVSTLAASQVIPIKTTPNLSASGYHYHFPFLTCMLSSKKPLITFLPHPVPSPGNCLTIPSNCRKDKPRVNT